MLAAFRAVREVALVRVGVLVRREALESHAFLLGLLESLALDRAVGESRLFSAAFALLRWSAEAAGLQSARPLPNGESADVPDHS